MDKFKIKPEKSDTRFKQVTSTVTNEEHQELIDLAKSNDLKINRIVRQMIRHCLKELRGKD